MNTWGQELLKEEVDAFVKKQVVPIAAKIDEERTIPRELIREMGRYHYLAPYVPSIYGGVHRNMIEVGLINEAFGKACSSVRGVLTVQGMVVLAILRWGTEEQKQRWIPSLESGEIIGAFGLSEAEAGTDARNIQTRAIESEDGFVLNGHKKWISLGQIADIYLIFAKCNEAISLFILERETLGLSINSIPSLLGLRGSMLAELTIDNCLIEKNNLVGCIGGGLSPVGTFCLDYGRYTVAWGCVGLSQSCLEHSMHYAINREQFGLALSEFQLIQKMITEMIVHIQAARLLCLEAGRLREEADPEFVMETWKAKYYASKIANEIAGNAIQIHGATGFVSGHPVERHYRDSKVYEIIEGTSQMHETFIAKNAFQMNDW